MKPVKIIAALIITVSLGLAGLATIQLIDVQRGMGADQQNLLEEVKQQDQLISDILPAFAPTEEMYAKTEAMLGDIQRLESVLGEMNATLEQINATMEETIRLVQCSKVAAGYLGSVACQLTYPLGLLGNRTSFTFMNVSGTVEVLNRMIYYLNENNAHMESVANKMEGRY